MSLLLFQLTGGMALWRNVYESMGSFSCLGPAPSNIAGILGAAMGFAAPRSQAASGQDEKQLLNLSKGGLPWPLSPELLAWEQKYDFHVAARWLGSFPMRKMWNVNGCKEIGKGDNLRIQQQIVENPIYEIAVRLPNKEAEKVKTALKTPAFPLYLGESFCRAVVKDIRIEESLPASSDWAFRVKGAAYGEAVPFSRHIVDPEVSFERIRSDGYWVYPVPGQPGMRNDEFLVRGWTTSKGEE